MEVNNGKALRDQLEKMEAKLSDTEEYREQHAAQLQKVCDQSVYVKYHISHASISSASAISLVLRKGSEGSPLNAITHNIVWVQTRRHIAPHISLSAFMARTSEHPTCV